MFYRLYRWFTQLGVHGVRGVNVVVRCNRVRVWVKKSSAGGCTEKGCKCRDLSAIIIIFTGDSYREVGITDVNMWPYTQKQQWRSPNHYSVASDFRNKKNSFIHFLAFCFQEETQVLSLFCANPGISSPSKPFKKRNSNQTLPSAYLMFSSWDERLRLDEIR